jgi:ribosomal protein S18 acetylase RimI-like enzyme
MPNNTLQGQIGVRSLNESHLSQIEALIDACRQREGLEGPLHLEPPRATPGGETNQFLYYKDGALIAIVTLPPDDRIELLGMVHPDHRRQGIGRALLRTARDECRRRGALELLLVCEEASPAGRAFALTMGGSYRFSEHRMELDATAFRRAPPRTEAIAIDRADGRDLETLVRLCSASADAADERTRAQVVRWLDEPNQRFYIGRIADQAIGVLRAGFYRDAVYLASFRILAGFEGYGFGRQMLETVAAELLSEGNVVRLEVETDNAIALALYRSCGFKPISTFHYYKLQT